MERNARFLQIDPACLGTGVVTSQMQRPTRNKRPFLSLVEEAEKNSSLWMTHGHAEPESSDFTAVPRGLRWFCYQLFA
jgi:hypothetical protein